MAKGIIFALNGRGFLEVSRFAQDRSAIKKWLSITLLKRTFGGQPDNVLRPIRQVIKKHVGSGFPLSQIAEDLKSSTRPMFFNEGQIADLLLNEYGGRDTFSVLSTIYNNLDFKNKFHQDHIFPRKLFTEARLKRRNLTAEKIDFFLEHYNRIGNLQLIEGLPNQEKSAKEFGEWIDSVYKSKASRKAYMERHFIPDVDFDVENFQEFIEKREAVLIERLYSELIMHE